MMRNLGLKADLVALGANEFHEWRAPCGRLLENCRRAGVAVSVVESLRPQEAEMDIDGEVLLLAPMKTAVVTLSHADFTVILNYRLWQMDKVLTPRQLAAIGRAEVAEFSAETDDHHGFRQWLERLRGIGG